MTVHALEEQPLMTLEEYEAFCELGLQAANEEPPPPEDSWYGWETGCPQCGGSTSFLNARWDHWGICENCKLRWRIGSNLFSSWQEEAEADWQRNAEMLSQFQPLDGDGPFQAGDEQANRIPH